MKIKKAQKPKKRHNKIDPVKTLFKKGWAFWVFIIELTDNQEPSFYKKYRIGWRNDQNKD